MPKVAEKLSVRCEELIEKVRRVYGEESAGKARLRLRRAAREDRFYGRDPEDEVSRVSQAIREIERQL